MIAEEILAGGFMIPVVIRLQGANCEQGSELESIRLLQPITCQSLIPLLDSNIHPK